MYPVSAKGISCLAACTKPSPILRAFHTGLPSLVKSAAISDALTTLPKVAGALNPSLANENSVDKPNVISSSDKNCAIVPTAKPDCCNISPKNLRLKTPFSDSGVE